MWKILACLSLCGSVVTAHGWIMPELYFGKQHILGQISTLVPITEPDDGLIFGYGRGTIIGNDCFEADFGIGYRNLFNDAVVGGYVFYDIFRSEKQRTFQQVALGFEAYTVRYVARLNGYIPLTDVQGFSGDGVRLAGSRVLFSGGSDMEASYGGVDAEVGIRFFSCWEDWGCPELRLFGGGYSFKRSGWESLSGFKGRAEAHFYDLLFSGSEIVVGVESFRHDLRAGQYAGFFRFQIPFGGRMPRCCCLQSNCCVLCDRLYERIESLGVTTRRIDDFCSGTGYFKGREISTAVVLRAGDDIVSIVPSLPDNALIIIDGTDGDIVVMDEVNMRPGHTITGGGSTIDVNIPGCPNAPLTLPGIPGNIVRPNVLGNVINMDDNGTIINIGVTGGIDTISAESAPDVMILDSRLATWFPAINAPDLLLRPIFIDFFSPRAMVARNEIILEHADELIEHTGIDASGFDHIIQDNFIEERTLVPPTLAEGRGMTLAGVFRGLITGNRLEMVGGTGVNCFLIDSLFDNNTILNAGTDGAVRSGFSNNTRFSNNTFTTGTVNTVNSMFFRGGNSDCIFENNFVEAFFEGSTGVTIDSSGDIIVRNNVLITRGDQGASQDPAGVYVDSGTTASLVENNIIDTFGDFGHGVRTRDDTGSVFRGNTIRTRGQNARGFFPDNDTSGLIFEDHPLVSTTGPDSPGIYSVDASNTNNTFRRNTFITTDTGSAGAELANVQSQFLDGNSFSPQMSDGLNLNNVNGIRASNNDFTNVGADVIEITDTDVFTGSDGNTWDGSGTMDCNDGGGNTGSFIDFGSPNPFMCP